jgi:hypothetical protein
MMTGTTTMQSAVELHLPLMSANTTASDLQHLFSTESFFKQWTCLELMVSSQNGYRRHIRPRENFTIEMHKPSCLLRKSTLPISQTKENILAGDVNKQIQSGTHIYPIEEYRSRIHNWAGIFWVSGALLLSI